MNCEICGAYDARRRAKIEGTILNVCDSCVRSGEEVARVEIARRPKSVYTAPIEMSYSLKEDFGKIIKNNREKKGLTQEQLAAKIQEKHTIVNRIENGWEPPLLVIKKLEKFLNIILRTASEEVDYKIKVKEKGLTLGDIAEIR